MSCDRNPLVYPLATLFIKVALVVGRSKIQTRGIYIQFGFHVLGKSQGFLEQEVTLFSLDFNVGRAETAGHCSRAV
jgi:hypothetical protein